MNTPETDKRVWSDHSEGILYQVVEASFARRLEIQRDEAREDLEFRRGLYKVQEEYLEEAREKAERYRLEANALMLQRDEARELADRYRVAYCSLKGDSVPTPFHWEDSE